MSSMVGRHLRWLHDTIQATCSRMRSSQNKEHANNKGEDRQQLIRELEDLRRHNMRRSNTRGSSSFDDWEETLWLHGVAVVAPKGADIPVLNICLGFENYELQNLDTTTYRSYSCSTQWDKVIGEQGFARLALEEFHNEPVIDGLPASIWLECVEPALGILIAIGVLRRRKGNLTAKRNERLNDSGHNQHGDFHVGPRPIFTLPRRSIIRLDTRTGSRAGVANRQEPARNPRRRNRQLYQPPTSRGAQDQDEDGPVQAAPVSVDLRQDDPEESRLAPQQD